MQCAAYHCANEARPRTGSRGPIPRFCSKNCAANHGGRFRRYGITDDIYYEMLELQQGRCAICGTDEPRAAGRGGGVVGGSFHIDHDHKTGKVRGLLCSLCNRGLGQFQDDPARLRAAATYLEDSY